MEYRLSYIFFFHNPWSATVRYTCYRPLMSAMNKLLRAMNNAKIQTHKKSKMDTTNIFSEILLNI